MLNTECYQTIQGWFNYADLYDRQVDTHADDARFVEIGSWLGRSTCYMAAAIARSQKRIHFFAVDLWDLQKVDVFYALQHQWSLYSCLRDGVFAEFLDNLKRCGVSSYVTPVRADANQAASLFADGSLDFVFLDADHSYAGVMSELHAWYPKLRPGGLIAGHDYVAASEDGQSLNPDVAYAVDAFFAVPSLSLLTSRNCWSYGKPLTLDVSEVSHGPTVPR